MAKGITKTAPQRLRSLRERAGLSMGDLARKAGYGAASGLQRYESDQYTQEYFSLHLVKKIAPHLIGQGVPPITAEELYGELTGGVAPGAPLFRRKTTGLVLI